MVGNAKQNRYMRHFKNKTGWTNKINLKNESKLVHEPFYIRNS
jgi:hypothetical protein